MKPAGTLIPQDDGVRGRSADGDSHARLEPDALLTGQGITHQNERALAAVCISIHDRQS
jgi:hypothetical protein